MYDINNKNSKIFNISLHRSGTGSFHSFMESGGIDSLHYPKAGWDSRHSKFSDIASDFIKDFSEYKAFCDIPVPSIYNELDKQFPDSKYILLIRDVDCWIKSTRRHTKNRDLTNLEMLQYFKILNKKIVSLNEVSDEI